MTKLFAIVSIVCFMAVAGCASYPEFRSTPQMAQRSPSIPSRDPAAWFSVNHAPVEHSYVIDERKTDPVDYERRFSSVTDTSDDLEGWVCDNEWFRRQYLLEHYDPDWVYRVSGNDVCLNPAYVGTATNAVLIVHETAATLPFVDGPIIKASKNGYCWSMGRI